VIGYNLITITTNNIYNNNIINNNNYK